MGTYFSISINAVENSYSIENNTSAVTVNLVCNCSAGWANDSPEYWIKVNGSVVKSGTRNFDHENFTISWSGTINHNEDGSGSFTYQGYFQGTDKPSGDTTSVLTKTLTKINRGMFRLNTSGGWKTGMAYVNPDGTWRLGQVFVNTPSGWKRGV